MTASDTAVSGAAGMGELSRITRVSAGFPDTMATSGDNSLQESSPNGVKEPFPAEFMAGVGPEWIDKREPTP